MTKLKNQGWFEQPRQSLLANVLYPHLADDTTRREMTSILAREGKKLPPRGLVDERKRGAVSPLGGVAISTKQTSKGVRK